MCKSRCRLKEEQPLQTEEQPSAVRRTSDDDPYSETVPVVLDLGIIFLSVYIDSPGEA